MLPDDAVNAAKKLWELFPRMKPAEFEYWSIVFQKFAADPVDKTIMAYADQYSTFVDRASFRTLLNAFAGIAPNAEQRLEKEKAEVLSRQRARQAERERCNAAREKVDLVLNGLPGEILDMLKSAAIRSHPELTDFLGQCDPKSSQILRSLMVVEFDPEAQLMTAS